MKKSIAFISLLSAGLLPAPSALRAEGLDGFSLGADFRARYEIIAQEGKQDNRERARIRLRIDPAFKVNEAFSLKARLSTGGNDRVSTNQTLEGFSSPKGIALDRAYMDYRRENERSSHRFSAGKFGVPFEKPAGSELIFDGDLNPEGLALQISRELGGALEARVKGGYFWLAEVKPASTSAAPKDSRDVVLGAAQLSLEAKGMGHSLAVGIGYYNYDRVQGTDLSGGGDFFGNMNDGSGLLVDYELVQGFARWGLPEMGGTRLALYADYVRNAGIGSSTASLPANLQDYDEAFSLGASLASGSLFETKDLVKLNVEYREVESDAVFGAFSDSDFGGGGTSGSKDRIIGTRAALGVKLMKGVGAKVTYFSNQTPGKYDRTQVDLSIKY